VKPAQIALAWMLTQPAITAPIVGASTLSHLDDAVGALKVQLSTDDVAFVEAPYQPHRVLGFDAVSSR
jgi:aryl-alcohol dehydrogenase-like predicted oxidoreductase